MAALVLHPAVFGSNGHVWHQDAPVTARFTRRSVAVPDKGAAKVVFACAMTASMDNPHYALFSSWDSTAVYPDG